MPGTVETRPQRMACGNLAGVTAQGIEEVRLTAFKSFRGEAFRLAPLTVLIGRNSSGKSNALDGLEVLSRLARGEDIAEALESRRSPAGPVRGGLAGCVPHGSDRFSLGCTVSSEYGPIHLDVTIQVEPEVQIIEERLSGPTVSGHKDVLVSGAPSPHLGDIQASWHNGRPGRNPSGPFRNSRLLTSQLPLRLAGDTEGEHDCIWIAQSVLSALVGAFHLDPVPHLMRQYVASRDVHLRRTAENLSAAIGNVQRTSPELFDRLVQLLRGLADHDIETLAVTKSELGDVMLALDEGELGLTPAREMSDGMLRFLAITTSLLTGGEGSTSVRRARGAPGTARNAHSCWSSRSWRTGCTRPRRLKCSNSSGRQARRTTHRCSSPRTVPPCCRRSTALIMMGSWCAGVTGSRAQAGSPSSPSSTGIRRPWRPDGWAM